MSIKCVGCGVDVQSRQAKVYCSNACQQSQRRTLLLKTWLETGVCGRTSYQGHYVRDYIYAQQGGCCAICGMAANWNGATLALVLDHVDGNATNNFRPNLRLICPNCDSQLPTYKARNRGNGRFYRRQRYADGQSF
ncbi:HNH endonuclease signature motif containing protein [Mycolicibacterium vinylchloridicum]|uniref:HNH endonuclease signature motif containing protein n=1 Tax=Mycolicibacterium vinylchloridicum TaxID=2736928 RepID=UPI0015CE83F9|nr:HNH endonuclease signature motif containing protein [Mycolicibacterium vinylchloridicum]